MKKKGEFTKGQFHFKDLRNTIKRINLLDVYGILWKYVENLYSIQEIKKHAKQKHYESIVRYAVKILIERLNANVDLSYEDLKEIVDYIEIIKLTYKKPDE